MTEQPHEAETVRRPEMQSEHLPDPVSVMVPIGRRHRCSLCHAAGREGDPEYMCHHCGRTFCAACRPTLPRGLRPFYEHRELNWWRGRGTHMTGGDRLFGNTLLEPAHCPYHVHYSPRNSAWVALVGLVLLAALGLLVGVGNSLVALLLPLLLGLSLGLLLYSQEWNSQQKNHLFFPLVVDRPLLQLRESFSGRATLDGDGYREEVADDARRGFFRTTVRLEPELSADLDRLERSHDLDEALLAEIPASAGAVVVENVVRVRGPEPEWPPAHARRWELSAPLSHWPTIWQGEGPRSRTIEYHYAVSWDIPRLPFKFAFPVQVQAHFPERGDRCTLELLFLLTGWIPKLRPFFQHVTVEVSEEAPGFQLQPPRGRPMMGAAARSLRIEDVPFDEDHRVARLLLRFDEELPATGELWLSGEVVIGVVATFSGLTIEAYYDAFGHRVRNPHVETISRAHLDFRINLAALPYHSTSRVSRDLWLDAVSARRDDAIVRALERETRVVVVHERLVETRRAASNARFLAPIREIMGHWPEQRLAEMTPAVYHVHLLPGAGRTRVELQVEVPITRPDMHPAAAERIVERLQQILRDADTGFDQGGVSLPPPNGTGGGDQPGHQPDTGPESGPGSGTDDRPGEGGLPGLLGKLRGR